MSGDERRRRLALVTSDNEEERLKAMNIAYIVQVSIKPFLSFSTLLDKCPAI